MVPDVELVNLTKRFGDTLAVDNLSLQVDPGEFLFLLGPSGCGKTTTLRMIAGLEEATEGFIKLAGRVVNELPSYKRDTGMVFQNWALFPHKTVYENIAFGLKMRGVPKKERKEKVAEYLALVRLPGIEEKMPGQLSGGMQQRIALARALIIKPTVLLLDEPLSNLDLALRQQMQVEISQLQKKLGLTSVFVTHDQTEALHMADRIAVMEGGRIQQVGTSMEVYQDPKTQFVAEFIGETNFFYGNVVSLNSTHVNVMTKSGLKLKAQNKLQLKEDSKVSISLRPEHVKHSRLERGSQENAFRGRVYFEVYMGSHIRYHLELDEENKLFLDWPMTTGESRYAVGDWVEVSWNSEDCLCFPRD